MNVVFVASEAVPFAKTGGLADVAGALPRALEKLGHSAVVVPPRLSPRLVRRAGDCSTRASPSGSRRCPLSRGSLYESRLPGSSVPVYLIDQPRYFDRDGLYGMADGNDYDDNCERFVFFNRAVLEAIPALHLRPDVIHCNDWQTGLIPVYLKTLYNAPRAGLGRDAAHDS